MPLYYNGFDWVALPAGCICRSYEVVLIFTESTEELVFRPQVVRGVLDQLEESARAWR